MQERDNIPIREALPDDLSQINRVIAEAISRWPLPERVKRLSLPSYLYAVHDLEHLEILLAARASTGEIVGVAALEPATRQDLPRDRNGMLLHALYVDPSHQGQGIGRRLIARVMAQVASRKLDGLLVKAQADAAPFFAHLGMQPLAVENKQRDYPHRFWQAAR